MLFLWVSNRVLCGKAGKIFDLLVIPGMGHGDGGPYGRLRKRDFFVKHLLIVEPPDRNRDQ
ncbi:hypothetical protein [Longitalea arenae]|uniref:hypothetical protein n=1 Tax=Longitalea arenae TaxID=2812558 RepID=UPI001967C88E|nr:hypothetical protein [Longitalea arenae]